MLRRPPGEDEPDEPVSERRRAALDEAQRLGGLYATLNYMAPLLRLFALGSFFFGHTPAYQRVLSPAVAAIVVGIGRVPLYHLSKRLGRLISTPAEEGSEDSSAYHQTSLVINQVLRVALLATVMAASLAWFDPALCGLTVPADGGHEALLGAAACGGMFVIWTVVHDRSPREALAIADSTADLSAASEDEMLRTMRPALRLASLTVRCLSVALETAAEYAATGSLQPCSLHPSHMRPCSLHPPAHATRLSAPGDMHAATCTRTTPSPPTSCLLPLTSYRPPPPSYHLPA